MAYISARNEENSTFQFDLKSPVSLLAGYRSQPLASRDFVDANRADGGKPLVIFASGRDGADILYSLYR